MSRLHSYQWTIPEGRMRRQVNPQCVFKILLSALPRPALQAVIVMARLVIRLVYTGAPNAMKGCQALVWFRNTISYINI